MEFQPDLLKFLPRSSQDFPGSAHRRIPHYTTFTASRITSNGEIPSVMQGQIISHFPELPSAVVEE